MYIKEKSLHLKYNAACTAVHVYGQVPGNTNKHVPSGVSKGYQTIHGLFGNLKYAYKILSLIPVNSHMYCNNPECMVLSPTRTVPQTHGTPFVKQLIDETHGG